MKEYTDEYLEHIRRIIKADRADDARAELATLHPADIAELYQNLDIDEAEYLYRLLDADTAADVLMELDEDDRRRLLDAMPPEQIARQIDHLDTDDAVDIIQQLDEDDRDEVLSHIDDVEQAGDIIDLLKYDEDTAGGLMGTEMLVVNENWSMPECIKQMRLQAEDMDEIYYVYVVDDDNKLRGILPLKKLITHPSVSKIKHVMETDPVSVKDDTPIDEVALDFEKYDLVAMPVVDSIGRLVGSITVDDVMDEVRVRSERDYQLASGLSSDVDAEDTGKGPHPLAADRYRLRHHGLPHTWHFRGKASGRGRPGAVHTHHRRYRRQRGRTVVGHRGAVTGKRFARAQAVLAPAGKRGARGPYERFNHRRRHTHIQPDYAAR